MNVFITQNSRVDTIAGVILDASITVQAAALITGYNAQYLRRLLRAGKLDGSRIGQVWLIRVSSMNEYLSHCEISSDLRFGSKESKRLQV